MVFGLASAKQTLLPPGEAVYAPQSAYWPRRVGCVSPPPGAGAAAVAAGLAGVVDLGHAGAAGAGAAGVAGLGGCWAKATDAKLVANINAVVAHLRVIDPPPVAACGAPNQEIPKAMNCLRNSAM